ncbi:MAG: hypothetical protein U0W24_22365 [Bacteroidales bacterium]
MNFKALTVMFFAGTIFFNSCGTNSGNSANPEDSITVTGNSTQSSALAVKKYDIKSGIITYNSDAMGIKSTQVLYFDDYGARERQENVIELEMMGIKTKTVSVSITKDGYKYDFETENFVGNENKLKKEIKKTAAISGSSGDMSSMTATMSDEMKKQYEYKEEGTETVAGVTGTKFSMKFGKAKISGTIYKKLMLKSEMDMVKIYATKFEENVTVQDQLFELPKDYEIVEIK